MKNYSHTLLPLYSKNEEGMVLAHNCMFMLLRVIFVIVVIGAGGRSFPIMVTGSVVISDSGHS